MAEQPLSYRRLRRILHAFGIEEDVSRGKGSHRTFVGVVDGRIVKYPTKCHNENQPKPMAVVKAIRRAFKLTAVDGIADRDFYSRG